MQPARNMSAYPKGFTGGLAVRGLAMLNSYSKDVLWVDSNGTSNGDGTFQRPHSSVDNAINKSASGDIILCKEGHAETLVAAGAVTQDVAGVSIVGLGQGNRRPTFTFTPAAVGTNGWAISAASCSVENIIGKPGLDAITNPFNVSAAGCHLDIEWQDASSAIEAETVILTTANADNLSIRLRYLGFAAGNACVAPIKLVGCTDGRVHVDFHGVASTAVVNFVTTLSTNVVITGYAFNSGTTDGSKLVVDTVGSSTWYAEIYDGAAGAMFSGGSGSTLAKDDVSAITDALYGANGVPSFPAAAVPANNVSLAEVLRDLWDAVRNGTGGSEPGTNKSLVDAIGFDGAAAVAASAGMLRTMAGTMFVVKKTLTSSAVVQTGVDVTAVSTTGAIAIEAVHLMTDGTGLAAGTNLTLETNNAKGKAIFLTEGVAQLGANATIISNHGQAGLADAGSFGPILETGKKVIAKCTVADCTGAGTVDVYLVCRRLADNAALAAA